MAIHSSDVTLYVPACNAARTLAAALDSVLHQTAAPREVLVIADARSTDDTLAIARRAGVQVIEQREGRLGFARNMAIEHCRTPWLASCDADVVLELDWLAELCAAADDTVVAVGGGTRELLKTPADCWRAVNLPHNWGPRGFDNPFMLVSEMAARVDVLRAVGGYRADWRYGEDSDLCQRLRQAGYRLRYEPAAVAHHDRADSVASVLDLRWNYAYFRQRGRFESLAGLIDKLAVNRAYVLQAISQTLHSPHPETCAIGVLIWTHHVRRDLDECLAHWPLLDAGDRADLRQRLDDALAAALPECWRGYAARTPASNSLDGVRPRAVFPALASAPGFRRYLEAVANATGTLLGEVGGPLLDYLCESAAYLAGDRAAPTRDPLAGAGPRLPGGESGLKPAWQGYALAAELTRLFGREGRRVRRCGPSLPQEGIPAALAGPECIAFPHLERSPNPPGDLRVALHGADLAVISYRTPTTFCAAVPILTARDLAILLTGEGFEIVDFQTEAGATRLIGRRAASVPKNPGPRVETAHEPASVGVA